MTTGSTVSVAGPVHFGTVHKYTCKRFPKYTCKRFPCKLTRLAFKTGRVQLL